MPSNVSLDALFGTGVFETLKLSRGVVVALEAHLERLAASARSACASWKIDRRILRKSVLAEIRKVGRKEAYVRLTLVKGENGKNHSFVLVRPPRKIPVRLLRRGVAIETTATRRNSVAALNGEIKAREFHNGLLSVLEGLGREGIFERIYLDRHGYVCEGTISNLFVVKGDILLTSPTYVGTLAGVTRSAVLSLGEREGLDVVKRPFTRFELYTAEEIFLTNTSFGILPVTKADGRLIGGGKVGPWTRRLRRVYEKEFI